MTNNREKRVYKNSVHMYMGLQRTSKHGNKNCIRQVIKDDDLDLKILEAKLRVFGGEWRIHKTVNARDVERARKWLLKLLIDNPHEASVADSAWRTALLQKDCIYGDKRFMLDIDTKDVDELITIDNTIFLSKGDVLMTAETPNGWHYITNPFDTREVCALENVTLIRDGYWYVKTVGAK